MVLAGTVSTIISTILSFPYLLDITIFLFLLISTSLGYAKGFWRGTFRFIFVVIVLLIAWFTLLDKCATFINESFLSTINVKVKVGTYEASSIKEVVELTIKNASELGETLPAKYSNEAYVSALSLSISKSIAWAMIVFIVQFISWIISGILYFLVIRLIIPNKVRKVKLKLLGALMGLAQALVVTFAFMISFSSISPAIETIKNPGKGIFTWCNQITQAAINALNPNNSMLSPFAETLEKQMSSKQYDFTLEGDESTYVFKNELKEFFKFFSDFNDKTLEEESSTGIIDNSYEVNY